MDLTISFAMFVGFLLGSMSMTVATVWLIRSNVWSHKWGLLLFLTTFSIGEVVSSWSL
jgi:hypothetical protein